jgi:hypothetical protein
MSTPPNEPWNGQPQDDGAFGNDYGYGSTGRAPQDPSAADAAADSSMPQWSSDAPAYGSAPSHSSPQYSAPSPAPGLSSPSYGGPIAAPPKKTRVWPFLVGGGCCLLVVILVVVVALVGFLNLGSDDTGGTDTGGTAGTREDPYPVGTTVELANYDEGTIEVVLGETNWEPGAAELGDDYSYLEPDAGNTWIIVPVTMTYHGEGSVSPLTDVQLQYVTTEGRGFDQEIFFMGENSASDKEDVYDGASVDFDVLLQISTFADWNDDAKFVAAS